MAHDETRLEDVEAHGVTAQDNETVLEDEDVRGARTSSTNDNETVVDDVEDVDGARRTKLSDNETVLGGEDVEAHGIMSNDNETVLDDDERTCEAHGVSPQDNETVLDDDEDVVAHGVSGAGQRDRPRRRRGRRGARGGGRRTTRPSLTTTMTSRHTGCRRRTTRPSSTTDQDVQAHGVDAQDNETVLDDEDAPEKG